MLSLLDLFSSTYIRELTGQTMQSGYLFMPAAQDSKSLSDSIINTVAALVFPLALSLLFPVMLYGIVL